MVVPMGRAAKNLGNEVKLRLCAPHVLWHPHIPLMGSITVNMFKPLVGTADGGATTGRVWPEDEATTTADEVDGSLVEEYSGGGAESEGP